MLVLTRKLNEKIVCQLGAETVTVAVVQSRRGRFRLALEASRSVVIHREEIARQIAGLEQKDERRADAAHANGKRPARIPS